MTATPVLPNDKRELCLVEGLTRTQIVQYAGASGDYNPLHTDEAFARDTAGLPTVFAHGMLTMGMTSRILTDWFGAECLVSYNARFAAQVWPGDTLTARANVESVRMVDDTNEEILLTVETTNQNNQVVLSGGVTIRRPWPDGCS